MYKILFKVPLWAYLLLVYFIAVGVAALKTHIVSFRRLIILPCVLLAFATQRFFKLLDDSAMLPAYVMMSSLVGGVALGWLHASRQFIQVDRKKKLVRLPGSWVILLLIVLIFFSKYLEGFLSAVYPEYLEVEQYRSVFVLCGNLPAGMLLGRSLCLLKCMISEAHTDFAS